MSNHKGRGDGDRDAGGNRSEGRLDEKTDKLVVNLSKSLSSVLRHNAIKFGLNLQADGYARLDELLKLPKFRGISLEKIQLVVKENDKQRFTLTEKLENGKPVWWIRANQGHSIEVKELELEKMTNPSKIPLVIHGTYLGRWDSIKSQGLSKMNRNHIHFATGRWGDIDVKSGMRKSCNLFIYINVSKAMKDGIEFYKSSNGVILSEGVKGTLDKKYFLKVVDKDENILYSEENSDRNNNKSVDRSNMDANRNNNLVVGNSNKNFVGGIGNNNKNVNNKDVRSNSNNIAGGNYDSDFPTIGSNVTGNNNTRNNKWNNTGNNNAGIDNKKRGDLTTPNTDIRKKDNDVTGNNNKWNTIGNNNAWSNRSNNRNVSESNNWNVPSESNLPDKNANGIDNKKRGDLTTPNTDIRKKDNDDYYVGKNNKNNVSGNNNKWNTIGNNNAWSNRSNNRNVSEIKNWNVPSESNLPDKNTNGIDNKKRGDLTTPNTDIVSNIPEDAILLKKTDNDDYYVGKNNKNNVTGNNNTRNNTGNNNAWSNRSNNRNVSESNNWNVPSESNLPDKNANGIDNKKRGDLPNTDIKKKDNDDYYVGKNNKKSGNLITPNIREPDTINNIPEGAVLLKKKDDDDYYVGKNNKKSGNLITPGINIREPDTINNIPKGAVLIKKKDDYDDDYTVKKKRKKGGKNN